jgi:hypothetical protein
MLFNLVALDGVVYGSAEIRNGTAAVVWMGKVFIPVFRYGTAPFYQQQLAVTLPDNAVTPPVSP